MDKRRAVIGLTLALAVMASVAPAGHADVGDAEPSPVVSPGLLRDLQYAWVGGKGVCGASVDDGGTTARYFVTLRESSNVSDRTGYYSRDLRTGEEAMHANPASSPSLACGVASGDGRWYAFIEPSYRYDEQRDVTFNALLLLDLATMQTHVIATGVDTQPVVFSGNSRYVFFMSAWSEPGGGAHPPAVFRYDSELEVVELATPATNGGLPNAGVDTQFGVSADGERIAFATTATNVGSSTVGPSLFVRDLRAASTTLITTSGQRFVPTSLLVTDDGSSVFYDEHGFPSSTGQELKTNQIVRVDVATGRRTVMVRTPSGGQPSMSTYGRAVSGDGRFLVFSSDSPDLVDDIAYPPPPNGPPRLTTFDLRLYLLDTHTGRVRLITRSADGTTVADSGAASVSIDRLGSLVVFDSDATNLVADHQGSDPQVFAYRVATDEVELVSRGPGGGSGGDAIDPTVSATGRRVLFSRYDYMIPGWVPWVASLPQITVTIASPDVTAPYGSAIPTRFEPAYTPAVHEGWALDAVPTCSTTAHTGVDVGRYPITCSGAIGRDLALRYLDGTFTVTPAPTTLEDTGITFASESPLDPLRATTRLLSEVTGRGLAGEIVVFSMGSWTCRATTRVDGVATCPVPAGAVLAAAGSILTARYNGARNYEATGATMSPLR